MSKVWFSVVLHRSELDEINWAAPAVAFPKITNLLRLKTYRKALLLGLAVSAGGITESLVCDGYNFLFADNCCLSLQ